MSVDWWIGVCHTQKCDISLLSNSSSLLSKLFIPAASMVRGRQICALRFVEYASGAGNSVTVMSTIAGPVSVFRDDHGSGRAAI
jgi:hypothetical protein